MASNSSAKSNAFGWFKFYGSAQKLYKLVILVYDSYFCNV